MTIIKEWFPEEEWLPLIQETLQNCNSPSRVNDLPGLGPFLKEAQPWPWDPCPSLSTETHKLYFLLRQRINRIQILLSSVHEPEITFALRMWQDAHIPLAYYYQMTNATVEEDKIHTCSDNYILENELYNEPNVERNFHEGELPNLLNYLPYCNYWRQTKKKKNFTFIEALLWLISKAIPWRCNVRAIRNTFTKDCIPQHPKIYDIIMSFLTCSMLGAYKHAKYAPCFNTRLAIYKYMLIDRVNKNWIIKWFENSSHQCILQNVIREFIVFGTANIPPLRESMTERHRWDVVEHFCYAAMDKFRQEIDEAEASGNSRWFHNCKELLGDFDNYHLKLHDYKPNNRLFVAKMAEECTNFDDSQFGNPEYREMHVSQEHLECLRQVIKRCINKIPEINDHQFLANETTPITDTIPLYLLCPSEPIIRNIRSKDGTETAVNININPFAIDNGQVQELLHIMDGFFADHDTKPIADFLHKLTPLEYQNVSNFFYFLRDEQSVRVRLLPMYYYISQLEALCKKYHVLTPADLPAKAGHFYYSPYCGFKGFLVSPARIKQKTSNLHACGSHDATYSYEKKAVYCFHKVNKSKRRKQNPKKRSSVEMFSNFKESNSKRLSKDQRKAAQQSLCSNSPLRDIYLIGFALECQEGLITLCCKCANPATFGINKYEAGKFVCTRCTEKKDLYNEVTCSFCKKLQIEGKENFAIVMVYDDVNHHPPAFVNVHLCKKCNRNWISCSNTIFSLSTIIKGLREKWRVYKPPAPLIDNETEDNKHEDNAQVKKRRKRKNDCKE